MGALALAPQTLSQSCRDGVGDGEEDSENEAWSTAKDEVDAGSETDLPFLPQEYDALLPTFYIMELRRMERRESGSVRIGATGLLQKICALFGLCIFLLWLTYIWVDSLADADLLIMGHECAESLQRLDGGSSVRACVNQALRSEGCGNEGKPVVMYPSIKGGHKVADEGCYCCDVDLDMQLPIIGKANANWDIYMYRNNYNRDYGFTSSVAITVAVVATLVGLAFLAWMELHREWPWLALFGTTCAVFTVWFLAAPLIQHSRNCTGGLWYRRLCVSVAQLWVIGVFLGILFVSASAYVWSNRIKPFLLVRMCRKGVGASWWWRISRELTSDSNTIQHTYLPDGWFSSSRQLFGYRGERDAAGRPHGQGTWFDNSFHGETLDGFWDSGIPAGKFRSREHGSNATFIQRPVSYVCCRDDCGPGCLDDSQFWPNASETCTYGTVQVEISVAGGFFPFLPKVRFELEQESLPAMVEQYKVEDKIRYAPRNGFEHLDHDYPDSHQDHYLQENATQPPRIIWHAGGMATAVPAPLNLESRMEALIFVHGLGTNLSQPLEKLGLLLSLGKCKPHILPIVFGWGCGAIVMYPVVKNYSLQYAGQLQQFFKELSGQLSTVHVICHSAGADLWLRCFPYIQDKFRKTTREGRSGGGGRYGTSKTLPMATLPPASFPALANPVAKGGGINLANVVFLNGDVAVESMAEVLPLMMRYCDRFTSYNDSRDVATTAGTYIQRLMPRSMQGWRDPDLDTRTETWGRRTHPVWLEPSTDDPESGAMVLRGPVITEVMPNVNIHQERCPPHGEDHYIDIIDCTHIDANINIDRHSYFAINSLMVEDICECISEKTPARSRAHLIKRHGNVYDFLAAPSAIGM